VIGGVKTIPSNLRAFSAAQLAACTLGPAADAVEGALLLVETLGEPGSIRTLEDRSAREVALYRGDRFVAVLGNRHSGTSEYGDVPPRLAPPNAPTLDLLARAGVVGHGRCLPPQHAALGFTRVKVLGVPLRGGRALQLRDLCPAPSSAPSSAPAVPTVLVAGSASEVGKTTACTALIRAFKRRGCVVGAAKLTGTGRLRDVLAMHDAGADRVHDFPEFGLATTYTAAAPVLAAAHAMLGLLDAGGCEVVVAELGGDLLEANADRLLSDAALARRTRAVVHVASDVVGIVGALALYRDLGVRAAVQATLPYRRNALGSIERLRAFGLSALDVADDAACDAYVARVLEHGDA
jgi:hypothetical protein